MKDFIEEQQQEIIKQFGLPKRFLEGRPPITATEIRLRQKVARTYIDNLQVKLHNVAYTIMFKMYVKHIGRVKISQYILKMIKTM